MLTSGSLSALQELLASWIAQDRNKDGNYFTSRVPKMAIYGAFISAPIGHVLINILQWLFAGRTSVRAKVAQILVSNLVVCFAHFFDISLWHEDHPPATTLQNTQRLLSKSHAPDYSELPKLTYPQLAPIQNSIYLSSMAIIAGARTFHQVRATVNAGFLPVMKVSWVTSPISLAFAQQFLPQETWVPFFNMIAFVIGTYINTVTKKKRIAALREKRARDEGAAGPPRY